MGAFQTLDEAGRVLAKNPARNPLGADMSRQHRLIEGEGGSAIASSLATLFQMCCGNPARIALQNKTRPKLKFGRARLGAKHGAVFKSIAGEGYHRIL
jgi:hypothetical protein